MKRALDDCSPARLKRARPETLPPHPPPFLKPMDAWVPGLGPAFYAAPPPPPPETMPAYAGLDPSFNASYPADGLLLHQLRHDVPQPEPELEPEAPGSARSACTSFTIATPTECSEYFGADTRLAMALDDVELDVELEAADDDEMMLDTPHAPYANPNPPSLPHDPTHALAPSSSHPQMAFAAPVSAPPPPPPSPVRARAHTAPSQPSQLHPLSHLHPLAPTPGFSPSPSLTPPLHPLQPRPQRPAVTPLQPRRA